MSIDEWDKQIWRGRGVMVGKYRIMERSQEAVRIIQEDLIVTLVGDGSRDGTRSSDYIYIYISTTESISFADRFNVKEKFLYKG